MTFATRTIHSSRYYLSLVTALIEQLKAQATDQQISDHLNQSDIKTATGGQWKHGDVKAALHKLRHYDTTPNRLHQAILQLCYDQVLHVSETLILFSSRKDNKAVM